MAKAFISTVPFGEVIAEPLELLRKENISYEINPLGRKLQEDELISFLGEAETLIAGTEPITKKVLDNAPNLRLIARVGVGLDSVDLLAAQEKKVRVCYTPEAPVEAVAELTIGLALDLLRKISISNLEMHKQLWRRYSGRRLSEVTFGIIGLGRIGTQVLKHLKGFGSPSVLGHDLYPNQRLVDFYPQLSFVSLEDVLRHSDVVSLHLPLTSKTTNMINEGCLRLMKHDSLLINTSRGGIVDETALYQVLSKKTIAAAAIDVFKTEPYSGPLSFLDNCILTAHMGSMSQDCRARMELEAVQDTIRFLKGEMLVNEVPKD